ncbi:MAG: ABC transporter ATP-binding protein [Anaerolineae bacterium]|nr:ABC transporter ATP-binding protein [Anaerolineae bacterium]
MASVKLAQLRRTFGTVKAVDNVNLDIADGEFIALLGPSGCGKTTTLRMVAGLEAVEGGQIHIGNRNVSTLPARERDVAMVFQDYALYPHMTIAENVGYPLKVRGVPPADLQRQVQLVADRLQIGGLLERRPAQLSGGQQQRVSLARAVVHKAQVTLYDEPLSNLDTKLRLEARAFLKHLQREVGVTSIYVTHDQAEAMALADRIVVMNAGKVMQADSPMAIYRRPANTFVASFIGSPPMNLLPCKVDQAARILRFSDGQSIQWSQSVPAQASDEVTLGIRPEHLHWHAEPAEERLGAEHFVTQALGGESVIVLRLGEHTLAIRQFTDDVPVLPSRVWLSFDPNRVYFYGADGMLLS